MTFAQYLFPAVKRVRMDPLPTLLAFDRATVQSPPLAEVLRFTMKWCATSSREAGYCSSAQLCLSALVLSCCLAQAETLALHAACSHERGETWVMGCIYTGAWAVHA